MLCTDILVPAGEPELAFIQAWNRLVDEKESYFLELRHTMDGRDLMHAYRARELIRQVQEVGHIDTIPYGLMLKTLDHFEISMDVSIVVIFLAGIITEYPLKRFF